MLKRGELKRREGEGCEREPRIEELQRSGGDREPQEKANVERKAVRVLAREHVCLKGICMTLEEDSVFSIFGWRKTADRTHRHERIPLEISRV